MCRKNEIPADVSPEVLQVLTDLDHEERSSNRRMGLFGKRVIMTKKMEKIIGVEPLPKKDDAYNEEGDYVGEIEFTTQSEPFVSGKEPISYERAKAPNRYKVRNEGY